MHVAFLAIPSEDPHATCVPSVLGAPVDLEAENTRVFSRLGR